MQLKGEHSLYELNMLLGVKLIGCDWLIGQVDNEIGLNIPMKNIAVHESLAKLNVWEIKKVQPLMYGKYGMHFFVRVDFSIKQCSVAGRSAAILFICIKLQIQITFHTVQVRPIRKCSKREKKS